MRVTVLGAGVAGLTTASRLLAAGCQVRVVAAAPIEQSTSYLAAAVWFPTHVGPADRVADWGRQTYDVLAEQAARGIPGVVMRESLALYREPPRKPEWADAVRGVRAATAAELPPGYGYPLRYVVPLVEMPRYLPWLAEQAARGIPGVVMRESLALYREPPRQPEWADAVRGVRAATAAELPPGYGYGLRYVVPLVEMPLYLPWLAEQVGTNGAKVYARRVHSLRELAEDGVDVIVNCSGLAARELVGDQSVYPVRGQIARVSNPGLSMSVRDEQHPEGRAYVHPRQNDCILGGTLDEHSWDTRVDLDTAASILRRCRDIAPALDEATVIDHVVGLRPGRPTVRLEEDARDETGPRILHNYGHGGAGITISWGCAEELTALVLRS